MREHFPLDHAKLATSNVNKRNDCLLVCHQCVENYSNCASKWKTHILETLVHTTESARVCCVSNEQNSLIQTMMRHL